MFSSSPHDEMRRALIQGLMTPKEHDNRSLNFGALANPILGAILQKKQTQADQARDMRGNQVLGKALQTMRGSPEEVSGGIKWDERKPNRQLGLDMLARAPETKDLGQQLTLANLQGDMDMGRQRELLQIKQDMLENDPLRQAQIAAMEQRNRLTQAEADRRAKLASLFAPGEAPKPAATPLNDKFQEGLGQLEDMGFGEAVRDAAPRQAAPAQPAPEATPYDSQIQQLEQMAALYPEEYGDELMAAKVERNKYQLEKAESDKKDEDKRKVALADAEGLYKDAMELVSIIDNESVAGKGWGAVAERGLPIAGPVGEIAREIPLAGKFTDAYQAEEKLASVRSRVVLDKMTRMKETSKTGATGFGSMNAEELKTIQNSMGMLDLIDPVKAREVLMRVATLAKNSISDLGGETPGSEAPAQSGGAVPYTEFFK